MPYFLKIYLQVEKLTKDSTRLNSEITILKDKINLSSSRKIGNEHLNFTSGFHLPSDGTDKPNPNPTSVSSTSSSSNQPILSNIIQNICPSSSAYLTTNTTTNSCRLAPGTLTDNSYTGRNSIMHPFTAHRSTGFNHTNHLHSTYPGSPGAPGRPSALSTGPTVRSLIQSIENQVFVVSIYAYLSIFPHICMRRDVHLQIVFLLLCMSKEQLLFTCLAYQFIYINNMINSLVDFYSKCNNL